MGFRYTRSCAKRLISEFAAKGWKKTTEKDVRPDDRNLEQFRPTILNIGCIGTAEGSALVKLGNTTVMCGIKAEISAPAPDQPNKGFIVPNVELGPMCSSMFRPGPPSEQAQDLSHFMNEVITYSCCINFEDLCIVPGKHVWVLHCDLVCLNYDGNVIDACVISLLAAFKSVLLPQVSLNEETDSLEPNIDKKLPLNVHSHPVSSTFAIIDNHILLVDPTVEEENLATGEVTMVTTDDQLCIVRKPGGSPLNPGQLADCVDRAFARSKEVIQLVNETLHSIDR